MLFMGTHSWPMEKTPEVGQVVLKTMLTLPPYVKMIGPFVAMGGEGVMVWTIWDVEKGHEAEGLLAIMKHRMEYASIGGQKFTLEPVLTADAFASMVGLSL